MLKGKIFPWKWNEPPNEKQFVAIIAGAIAAFVMINLLLWKVLP